MYWHLPWRESILVFTNLFASSSTFFKLNINYCHEYQLPFPHWLSAWGRDYRIHFSNHLRFWSSWRDLYIQIGLNQISHSVQYCCSFFFFEKGILIDFYVFVVWKSIFLNVNLCLYSKLLEMYARTFVRLSKHWTFSNYFHLFVVCFCTAPSLSPSSDLVQFYNHRIWVNKRKFNRCR